MSNEVKNAIDTGLMGLCVTEGDVAAILRRVRSDAHRRSPQRMNWRFGLALAAVMLALVAAVGLRLTSQGIPDTTPLTQPGEQQNREQSGFVPVVEAEPVVNIDAGRAIALAEDYVRQHHDSAVELRDAACYEISCEYMRQETEEGKAYLNFYAVRFRALTAEGTEYALRVSAQDGSILSCHVQRGVGENHTAQEIWTGYARIYGSDRRTWTQEQLRTCCQSLRKAQSGSMRWEDYLYLLSSYPEVAENAMTREEVIAAVTDDLDMLMYEYDRSVSDMPRWTDAERIGGLRARYIGAYPNPVWKVAADQRVVNTDGYETVRTLLIEIDSVTGAVLNTEAVEALYAGWHESFTRSTISALMVTGTNGAVPSLEEGEGRRIAAEYIRTRWGEARDVNDASLFTCTEAHGDSSAIQVDTRLVYRSVGEGAVTEYVVVLDWYGGVMTANRSVTPAGQTSFTPVATDAHWYMENLLAWQASASQSPHAQEPAWQAFIHTVWLEDTVLGMPRAVQNAALAAIGAKNTTRLRSVKIDAEPNPVWKIAVESDQGNYLIELDSVTNQIVSTLQVGGLYDEWYLPFVLMADLEAAGAPIPQAAAPAYLPGATQRHGTSDGMRVDHLCQRFKQLYGPNMGQWTQEQLRSFQQMAVLSSDYDYDLAVPCLRSTVYPDVPEGAISREAAMNAVIAVISGGDDPSRWQLSGAVLIGTKDGSLAHGTPVWKVCIRQPDGCFWYAEVNCMTGGVFRLHQDADGAGSPGASYDYGTPQNLWFRDIVLEDTIEDCDVIWDCRGNG